MLLLLLYSSKKPARKWGKVALSGVKPGRNYSTATEIKIKIVQEYLISQDGQATVLKKENRAYLALF